MGHSLCTECYKIENIKNVNTNSLSIARNNIQLYLSWDSNKPYFWLNILHKFCWRYTYTYPLNKSTPFNEHGVLCVGTWTGKGLEVRRARHVRLFRMQLRHLTGMSRRWLFIHFVWHYVVYWLTSLHRASDLFKSTLIPFQMVNNMVLHKVNFRSVSMFLFKFHCKLVKRYSNIYI